MVGAAGTMFGKQLQRHGDADAHFGQSIGAQSRFGPVLQRPAEPGVEWHGQSPLAAIHDFTREVTPCVNLEKRLGGEAPHSLPGREARGVLHHRQVKEWCA